MSAGGQERQPDLGKGERCLDSPLTFLYFVFPLRCKAIEASKLDDDSFCEWFPQEFAEETRATRSDLSTLKNLFFFLLILQERNFPYRLLANRIFLTWGNFFSGWCGVKSTGCVVWFIASTFWSSFIRYIISLSLLSSLSTGPIETKR